MEISNPCKLSTWHTAQKLCLSTLLKVYVNIMCQRWKTMLLARLVVSKIYLPRYIIQARLGDWATLNHVMPCRDAAGVQ